MQHKIWAAGRRVGLMLLAAGRLSLCCGQDTNVAVTPDADSFVRSLAPDDNYGAAGALSVSGSAATNSMGQQNGLFDTLVRFPMWDLAASLNATFGSNGWVVTGLALNLTENATPNNAIFNRGIGAFEVRWIASNGWIEGSGNPRQPTDDGVTYQDLGSILNPAVDASLGYFTNSGVSELESFPLPLASALVSNILAGADLSLYLTAASPAVGFTFNSRDFSDPGAWPSLAMQISAKPAARISSIERVGPGKVAIRFSTASNWNYAVQAVPGLPTGPTQAWSNVFTVLARPADGQAVFLDDTTNRQTFYRLAVTR
ncbi:MAG TPA: hypothetical protein VMU04_07600 [Candidatus Acidoferrum sp.]|nr:hypothetical protein [Candidatus Acidoferrum sp.]